MDEHGELIEILCRINDTDIMSEFLDEILTRHEREDLDLRWKLMKMLKKKVPQREISSKLHISLCKITRGSKILKRPDSISRAILDKKI